MKKYTMIGWDQQIYFIAIKITRLTLFPVYSILCSSVIFILEVMSYVINSQFYCLTKCQEAAESICQWKHWEVTQQKKRLEIKRNLGMFQTLHEYLSRFLTRRLIVYFKAHRRNHHRMLIKILLSKVGLKFKLYSVLESEGLE